MLQDQIRALDSREANVDERIASVENELKRLKEQKSIIKKAKKSLLKLEGELHSTEVGEETGIEVDFSD